MKATPSFEEKQQLSSRIVLIVIPASILFFEATYRCPYCIIFSIIRETNFYCFKYKLSQKYSHIIENYSISNG